MRTLEPELSKLGPSTVEGVEANSELVGQAVEGEEASSVLVVLVAVQSATDSILLISSFSEVLLMAESLLKFSLFFPHELTRDCLVDDAD